MKKRYMTIILFIAVFLVACNENNANEEISSQQMQPQEVKKLVNAYSVGNITDETASITSTELIITDSDEKEAVHQLPEEEFFVSIAPFIKETHPCTNHSLTGCQGELVDQDFDFYIEDMDGNVVIDETINSEANGFVDLWLPRDQTYTVNISHEDKQVTSEISTFEQDGTCITTMQLK